ncbi:MAG: NADP-dependent phosphogluconate dehydrogenase [Planctomycetes bacterium]|nr:NADP-dependent phosphogluconate dehydrogenase [Planctomycetota bacterium]
MTTEHQVRTADFGMVGLGVMGRNLALNVEEHGFSVAVWNLESDWTDRFLAENSGKQLIGTKSLAELVESLAKPRKIMLMVTAGAAVDSVIDQLEGLLEPGDAIIDGGNTWFEDTRRREQRLRERGIRVFGVGVSGGEEGARHGPSLMPGGDAETWEAIRPIFEAIAAKTESGPCVTHVGSDGAGHFVKMVHNGIEYADMQLIAETYDVLRRGFGMTNDELADTFAAWNRGELESFLVEITATIFEHVDPETQRHTVDLVLDKAGQKGTGRWTCQSALALGVPVPSIQAALDARGLSALKDERVAASSKLHGPEASAPTDRHTAVSTLHDALWTAKVCAYAQGLTLISSAAREYGWEIDLAEIARIWKGGCIIRAKLLDEIMQAWSGDPKPANLLVATGFPAQLERRVTGLRQCVGWAAHAGVPAPAMSASLAYFDAYRTATLPQNLTQAQRDAFGAHTFVRSDRPDAGPQHVDWL